MESIIATFELIREYFLPGFIAMLALALIAPFLGVLLVVHRMPLLGLAIPKMAACGQACALWVALRLSNHPSHFHAASWLQYTGSALGTLLGLVLIFSLTSHRFAIGLSAGIAYLLCEALQDVLILHLPHEHGLDELIHHGRLLTVEETGRNIVVGAAFILGLIVLPLYRRLTTAALDPDQAKLLGIHPGRSLFVTLLLTGLLSTCCSPIVGPEGVLALLLIPPALLRRAAPSFALYTPLTMIAGLIGVPLAYVLACHESVDWPMKPALLISVTLSSTLLGLLVRTVRWFWPISRR
ncbi:MAG TPA: iron chelate uptake ABC transporter family permease subunit [Planctomycetota bacterium]|jgi:zinc transport system permease protein|nr:iron chelate uptake ABC transporter family permease subunit [Planctomycetota bacterium]